MPHIEQVFPRKGTGLAFNSGNMNFDTRTPNLGTAAFDHYLLADADLAHFGVDAIETIAPLGTTTGGQPRQYAGINKIMHRLDSGVITSDTTFADVIQGMVICDNGSGAKILLVSFGSSASIKNAKRDLSTDTTPWTTTNAGGGATFWQVTKAGADIYAATDAGICGTVGDYHVSKCPAGNDPTLATQWGNGLEVGTPEWIITGLAAIGDSIVAGKPDGLYYYNDQTKRFENVLPHLVGSPHALNGKGMKSVTNGVLYPTHDGKLYLFDGVSVQEVTPGKGDLMPKDTGITRISAIADNGDTVAVVTDCWQKTSQSTTESALGLKVITFIAGTWADRTIVATNGDFLTGFSMATFGAAANDALYVGSNVPLEAITTWVTRNPNAATQQFTTPAYSNGTAGTVSPFDSSFTAFTAGVDGTSLGTATVGLATVAFPSSASNAVLTWTDIDSINKSTSASITFPAPISDDMTKYWYRWKRTTATGFSASTTIDQIEAIPCRAGLPNKGILTQSTNFTPRDRAGGITHVYFGKRERTIGFKWHDVYAVHSYGGAWAMSWHNGRLPSLNMGQSLVLWGRFRRIAISESPTRDPSRAIAPKLSYFSSARPGPILNLAPGGTVLGNPTWRKQINRVMIDTRYLQPNGSMIHLYAQWDETDIFYVGAMSGGPGSVEFSEGFGEGRYLQLWAAIDQDGGEAQINAPEIRGCWIEYDTVGEEFDFAQDQAASIPPRT